MTDRLLSLEAFERRVAEPLTSFILVGSPTCAPCAVVYSALAHLFPQIDQTLEHPPVFKFVLDHGQPETRAFKLRVRISGLPTLLQVGSGAIENVTASLELSNVVAARTSLREVLGVTPSSFPAAAW